jgi:hypothetical protein
LLVSSPAGAHQFCVSTAAELQNALTEASDGGMYDAEDNIILLRNGTFRTGAATANGPFHYHGSSPRHIDIYGGFTANCVDQTHDASGSILDGQNATQVLNVRSAQGPIDMAYFTVQNGESTNAGAGVSINSTVGDNAQASISNLIIKNNHSSASAGGLFAATGTGYALYLEDSLIVGNSADNGNGAGNLLANGDGATVANCTITQNTTSLANGTGGLRFAGAAACNCGLVNNIIWNNDNAGLFLATANISLSYNDYGTLGGMPPGSSNGNFSDAPMFVDAAGGDFHLRGASPAIGATPQGFGGTDVEGHPAPGFRSLADLGAYFESIFIDGFD